jgi:gliding motility-associated-like protein
MKRSSTHPFRLVGIIIIILFYLQGNAQVKPADEDYNGLGTNNVLSTNLVKISLDPSLPLTYGFARPTTIIGTSSMYLGLPQDIKFKSSEAAFFFNYTTLGAVPGLGQGGGGDYRISFSGVDTTQKAGNFGMQSMYLAIGSGNTATITVQGFRAGRIVAQSTITGLSTNNTGLSDNSSTDLVYSVSDQYSGLMISFGTNWQFLDGLRFLVSTADVPLSVDKLQFRDALDVAPSTQAISLAFANTTGVSSQLSWSAGSGDSVAVFMAATNSGNASPATHTLYKSNSTFGLGDEAGTGWFCVYRGADAGTPSTSVYGLAPGTTYRTMVVSYNGAINFENYRTIIVSNIGNFSTIAVPTTQANTLFVLTDPTNFKKANINWTRGNGYQCAVFVRNNTTTTDATVAPLNNNHAADAAHYTYSRVLDSVSLSPTSTARVGNSDWYCVFNGPGNGQGVSSAVTMSRITVQPGQTLRVMVVEYNAVALEAGSETYNTTTTSNVIDYFNPDYPLPVTNAATGITTSAATINGSINPRNGNITGGSYVYSTNPLLATVLGTITTLSPTATSILGSASTTAVSAALTGLSPSTTYYYRLGAVSNAGALSATNNTSGASNGIMSFTTAPVVSTVSASTANGSYKAGDVVTVTVGFTSAVAVTGTPTIALNTGAVANYTSGSGTNTLSFNYTIAPSQTSADLDYTTTTALLLAGGTIKDLNGNDALLTLPTVGGGSSLGGQKNIIIDTQIPLVTTATIVSNNASSTLAKAGDLVTLSFTFNETIQTPVVTIAGHSVSASTTGGNNWTATYTMLSADPSGNISFNIPFNDVAGNAGAAMSATTNSSSVTFDKTAPVFTSVNITSNNANPSLAKTGDLITLSFTSGETINSPTVTIAGSAAAITHTGNNWIATYATISSNATGSIIFNISFSDLALNAGIEVKTTSNSSSVIFDKTVPSLLTVSISSDNTNIALAKAGDVVRVGFTSNENIVAPSVSIAGHTVAVTNIGNNDWTATYTMTSNDVAGIVTMKISNIADLAGNAGVTVDAPTKNVSVTYDNSAPTLTSVAIVSDNVNNALAKTGNKISISFAASETVTTPTVTIAGNAASVTNTSGNNWIATYTMKVTDAAGTIAFTIAFADLTGNNGVLVNVSTNSTNVVFDKTAPVVAAFTFTGGNAISFALCQDANDRNISSLLPITGAATGSVFTWTIASQPVHGTVLGFPGIATATSPSLTPSGLIYKPTTGYSGTDVFVVAVSNGNSTITSTVNVTINATPVATLSSPLGNILCGTAATLTLQAGGGNSYAWFNSGLLVPAATGAQLAITSTGSYKATVTNVNGCSINTSEIVITQLTAPAAAFNFDSYCTNKAINFTNQSVTANSGNVTYLWSDGTSTSTGTSPVFTYTQAGTYNMKLTVTPAACAAIANSITKAIIVESPAVAIRMPSLNIISNTPVTLASRTFGTAYTWLPATGLSNANISNPIISLSTEQAYTINILAAAGCVTVDTLLVRIFSTAKIIVPSVFSPNGDGINDALLPNLVDVRVFQYFRVFSRTGKKIFESNDPTRGWDGKVNGERQPSGTYMWSAAGLDKNGVLVHGEGSITILR